MKRRSLFSIVLSALLSATIVFTVSVQEVHYLFADHGDIHEHCDNHLHQSDDHAACSICKFNISLFTDQITSAFEIGQPCTVVFKPSLYSSYIKVAQANLITLRGPPAVFS